jgi:hypothetical protein
VVHLALTERAAKRFVVAILKNPNTRERENNEICQPSLESRLASPTSELQDALHSDTTAK